MLTRSDKVRLGQPPRLVASHRKWCNKYLMRFIESPQGTVRVLASEEVGSPSQVGSVANNSQS